MKTIQDRLNTAKNYVIDHAPEIVTAVAAVSLVVTVRNHIAFQHRCVMNDRGAISDSIDAGYDFEYYPGLGVLVNRPGPTK